MRSEIKRWVFARHSNPASAWSRWASTPLILIPIWTRRWSHAGAVAAWMVFNAVIFPSPKSEDAWATKAMLGEELWIEKRPRDAAMAINGAATAAAVCSILAARRRMATPAAAATMVEMALLLAYWHHMVLYYKQERGHI